MKALALAFFVAVSAFAQAPIAGPVVGGNSGGGGGGVTINRELYPASIASGSGTEASPWTYSDSTGGIQTNINTLAADRGGVVHISPGNFTVGATISVTTPAINLIGSAPGLDVDPDGSFPSITGSKLNCNATGGMQCITVNGNRIGNVQIRDLYMQGTSRTVGGTSPYNSNAGVAVVNYPDQLTLSRLKISKFGVGVALGGASGTLNDAPILDGINVVDSGMGVYLNTGIISNYLSFRDSLIYDNDGQGVNFEWRSGTVDHLTLENIKLVRNCPTCSAGVVANMLFGRNYSLLSNIDSDQPGVCYNGRDGCGGGYTTAGDGLYLYGSHNVVQGGQFTNSGLSGIHLGCPYSGECATFNVIRGVRFLNNTSSDITLDVGANDNKIDAPDAVIVDNGARNVINGYSHNCGNPASAGAWNGVAKWQGLNIIDDCTGVLYSYASATEQLAITATGFGANSPTQWWKINEGTGTTFAEAEGSGNTLTGTGVTFGTITGLPANAAHFGGSSNATGANHTFTNFDGTTAFSISVWASWDSAAMGNEDVVLSTQSSGGQGYRISKSSINGIEFVISNSGTSNTLQVNSNLAVPDNALHLVTITYDGSRTSGGTHVYFDGTDHTFATPPFNNLSASAAGAQNIIVGNGSYLGVGHTGYIGDVRIWPRVLASGEVSTLFSAGAQ